MDFNRFPLLAGQRSVPLYTFDSDDDVDGYHTDFIGDSEEQEEGEGDDFDHDEEIDAKDEEKEGKGEVGLGSGGGCRGLSRPGAELDGTSRPDCPICLDAWTSDGPHRVCCIPCGHVYGRSCLERWLLRHGKEIGNCPKCKRKFKQKDIINLYVPTIAVPNDDLQKELEFYRQKYESLMMEGYQVTRHTSSAQLSDAISASPRCSYQLPGEEVSAYSTQPTWSADHRRRLAELENNLEQYLIDLHQKACGLQQKALEMQRKLEDLASAL